MKHFLNIGAHFGTTTLPLASKFTKITAVEAYPKTFQQLKRNIELNNITNIDAFNIALGNTNEPIKFMDENIVCPVENVNRYQTNTGGMHIFREWEVNAGVRSSHLVSDKYIVECHRLDDTGINDFDIVVIDVEGMEIDVIDGAKQKILRYKPIIICEIWGNEKRKAEKMHQTSEDVIGYICNLGYKEINKIGEDYIFMPNEKK